MQPPPQPRLDCAKHLGQRVLGIALNRGLGWFVFPKVNCGQGISLPTRRRELARGSYRLVGSG
jgi:hypothetical protein